MKSTIARLSAADRPSPDEREARRAAEELGAAIATTRGAARRDRAPEGRVAA